MHYARGRERRGLARAFGCTTRSAHRCSKARRRGGAMRFGSRALPIHKPSTAATSKSVASAIRRLAGACCKRTASRGTSGCAAAIERNTLCALWRKPDCVTHGPRGSPTSPLQHVRRAWERYVERDLKSLATGWRCGEKSVELLKVTISDPAKGKDQKFVFVLEVMGEDTHAETAPSPNLADRGAFNSYRPNDFHSQ